MIVTNIRELLRPAVNVAHIDTPNSTTTHSTLYGMAFMRDTKIDFTWYSPNCRHTMPFQKSSHSENIRCSPARRFIQFDTTPFRTFFAVTAFDHWARDIQFNKFEINFVSSQCQINWISCTAWRVHGETQIHENVVMRRCGLKRNVCRNSFWCENKNESIYEVWHSIEHFTADTRWNVLFVHNNRCVFIVNVAVTATQFNRKKEKCAINWWDWCFIVIDSYEIRPSQLADDRSPKIKIKWFVCDRWFERESESFIEL